MESRSRETTPTKEDLDFIVDDGYRHDEDPDYVPPNERFILTGDKKELKELKNLVQNHLITLPEKIINIWPHFQAERKYILVLQSTQTTQYTRIKREEINIYLELQR